MFYDYASALSEWLTPYHDYARPPPSVVLAEAAKMTEQKTGHPLRGLEISPEMLANGSAKKDEEPPAVVEPPAAISGYFDGACIREEYRLISSLVCLYRRDVKAG